MSLLFESIKIEDGKICNLKLHEQRMNKARLELFGASPIRLKPYIKIPEGAQQGVYKCRISYEQYVDRVVFLDYQVKKIGSLKVVKNNKIEYDHKYKDRDCLHRMYQKRGRADDVIIIKNSWVTDSYYANLVFWNGEEYHTSDTPLLDGVKRRQLIESGKIKIHPINVKSIKHYQSIHLINAFLDLGDVVVDIKDVAV